MKKNKKNKNKKFDTSQENICDYIYSDYVADLEHDASFDIEKKLPLLVGNNLAWKTKGRYSPWFISLIDYRVICKFMQKYNKKLKNYRLTLSENAFGGSNQTMAIFDKRLLKLAKQALQAGTYYAQIGDSEFAFLKVDEDPDDHDDFVYEFYIIGKKWKKFKAQLDKMIEEYKNIDNSRKHERIEYLDGRATVDTVFKPFDKVIMRDKDKIIKYIDNWVNNIPLYYEKYSMNAKLSIILYGEPGTGKSTFCRSLAKYLDIETVTSIGPDYFNSDERDNRRSRGLSRYSGTVLSLDDIDCLCVSREIDKSKENNETVSNVLDFLDNPPTFYFKAKDGVKYPVSIVVATTNYFDKLDPAVKRYGRFDLQLQMNNFNKKEAQEMCDIYNLKLEDIVKDSNKKDFTISPSKLQALCLENIDNTLKNIDNKN